MKIINAGRLNVGAALKIVVLLGFAVFFLRTVFTGSASLYVHPRINAYMLFAAAVMILIAALYCGELFRPYPGKSRIWPLAFYIIPLLMAFALPAQSLVSGAGPAGDVQISSGAGLSDGAFDKVENTSEDGGLVMQNGVIVMDGGSFYDTLCRLYTDIDRYAGQRVEVTGFVFKDSEQFADYEFVPARMMMVCCAADMVPAGLLCRYGDASQLKADSWVKVTGAIAKTTFHGETIPCIVADSVEDTDKPAEEYIYPY